MTEAPQDLTIRPIAGPDELELFAQLPYILNGELADDLEAGRRLPEWMWIATRDGRLLARAAWWARWRRERPFLLDIFDLADYEAALASGRRPSRARRADGARDERDARRARPSGARADDARAGGGSTV